MDQLQELRDAMNAQNVAIAEFGQKFTTEVLQINAKLDELQAAIDAQQPVDVSDVIAQVKANTATLIQLGESVQQIIPDPVVEPSAPVELVE